MSRVTVLVPAHNEEDVIADSVRALLTQSKAPDRVVVVSDNSTDATVDIAKSFGCWWYRYETVRPWSAIWLSCKRRITSCGKRPGDFHRPRRYANRCRGWEPHLRKGGAGMKMTGPVQTVADSETGAVYILDLSGDNADVLEQLNELPRGLAVRYCRENGMSLLSLAFAIRGLTDAFVEATGVLKFLNAIADRLPKDEIR